jgi:nucleotide-binding universal stress UspA family protein
MAIFSRLLVAVDGGELTDTITDYALRLGKDADVVEFLCAVDPATFYRDAAAEVYGVEGSHDAVRQVAQDVVNARVAAAAEAGIRAQGRVIEAAPVDAITRAANEIDADVIIMATHGRKGFARAVLGSVADGVARNAKTAVLLVPTGLAEADPSRHLHQIFKGL